LDGKVQVHGVVVQHVPHRREGVNVSTLLVNHQPLSADDRCDRCGAQAYVRVVLTKSDLLFCAHHARRHELKLREVAREFHDESGKLAATPSSAPDDER